MSGLSLINRWLGAVHKLRKQILPIWISSPLVNGCWLNTWTIPNAYLLYSFSSNIINCKVHAKLFYWKCEYSACFSLVTCLKFDMPPQWWISLDTISIRIIHLIFIISNLWKQFEVQINEILNFHMSEIGVLIQQYGGSRVPFSPLSGDKPKRMDKRRQKGTEKG